MVSLSLRARLLLLVGAFFVVSLSICAVGVYVVMFACERYDEIFDSAEQARRYAIQLQRDFEAANGLENALLTMDVGEESARYMQDEDKLIASVDAEMAELCKLASGEQLALLEQMKVVLERWKRHDRELRKLFETDATHKALALYRGEHRQSVDQLQEILRRGAQGLARTQPQASAIAQELHLTFVSADHALAGLALETSENAMATLARRRAELLERMNAQLEALLQAGGDAQRHAQRVSVPLGDYMKSARQVEALTQTNERERMIRLSQENDSDVVSGRALLSQLTESASAHADRQREQVRQTVIHARIGLLALSLGGIVAAFAFAIVTVRRVDGSMEIIRRVARQVAEASALVRESTQAIARHAAEQATALEETSSTMEEMSASVEQNRSSAMRARELAAQNGETARQNAEVATHAAEAMDALRQAGAKISEISDTVREIAFQTNILALNASVEAARAGEHGRGFSVVASEVRTLSQRAASAAREISGLIKDGLGQIEQGAELVTDAAVEMKRIAEGSGETSALVTNISTAAQEQASGVSQMTQSILQLNGVVQSNSAQVEELATSADVLATQARDLLAAISTISGQVEDLENRTRSATPLPLRSAPHEAGAGEPGASAARVAPSRARDFKDF